MNMKILTSIVNSIWIMKSNKTYYLCFKIKRCYTKKLCKFKNTYSQKDSNENNTVWQ